METQNVGTSVQQEDLGGKYLTFSLGTQEFGVPILTVKEIIGLLPITQIPQAPAFVRGMVNLRGSVIPVVELRKKFQMESVEDTEQTCIIVVQTNGANELGMVVDQVSEVLDIPGNEVVEPVTLGGEIRTDYILGIGKSQGRITMLLDLISIFPPGQLNDLDLVA